MKISELSLSYSKLCVGKDTPLLSKKILTCKQFGSCRQRDEKSIPALKINILRDMAVSNPYLVPTQFQELIFPLIIRPKIPSLG
jgi:hypothetical protein